MTWCSMNYHINKHPVFTFFVQLFLKRIFCAFFFSTQSYQYHFKQINETQTDTTTSVRNNPGINGDVRVLWAIGRMSRVLANGPRDWDSIPGRVIPKTQKMVLDAALLNTQHYNVTIRVKWSNPENGVAPTPRCSSY